MSVKLCNLLCSIILLFLQSSALYHTQIGYLAIKGNSSLLSTIAAFHNLWSIMWDSLRMLAFHWLIMFDCVLSFMPNLEEHTSLTKHMANYRVVKLLRQAKTMQTNNICKLTLFPPYWNWYYTSFKLFLVTQYTVPVKLNRLDNRN